MARRSLGFGAGESVSDAAFDLDALLDQFEARVRRKWARVARKRRMRIARGAEKFYAERETVGISLKGRGLKPSLDDYDGTVEFHGQD